MRTCYTGQFFEFTESDLRVTGAAVTKDRVAVDWIEDGEPGGLVATSDDGATYRGNYGYPRPEPYYHAEFRLFRARDGEVLLFGRWWRTDNPDGGPWLIQLHPRSE
jgi:hypothetical protein